MEEFKKKYLSLNNELYRIALHLTLDRATAADMVQETYLKLWNRRENLARINDPRAYCIRTLRNLCFDLRKSVKTEEYPPGLPSEESAPQYNTGIIRHLIDCLPEPHRSVMIMVDLQGVKHEEAARITGLSAGNIRVILSRARKTVREKYKKNL